MTSEGCTLVRGKTNWTTNAAGRTRRQYMDEGAERERATVLVAGNSCLLGRIQCKSWLETVTDIISIDSF